MPSAPFPRPARLQIEVDRSRGVIGYKDKSGSCGLSRPQTVMQSPSTIASAEPALAPAPGAHDFPRSSSSFLAYYTVLCGQIMSFSVVQGLAKRRV